jgi:hypothetical protein
MSRDSTVGIATGWTAGVRFPARARDISLLHSVHTSSEAHPASYPVGTGGSFTGVKRPGREADHSPQSSVARSTVLELYLYQPPHVFIAWCLIIRRNSFTILPFTYGQNEIYRYTNHYLLTYLRNWALLEKPPIVQPLKNFPAFYGTWRFITVFTRALQWSLSWARSTQSTPSHPISKIHFNIVHPPTSWSS